MNDSWPPEDFLLPSSAAAGLLGISVDTLKRMHRRGEGPRRVRVSHHWRYAVADIRRWKLDRSHAAKVQSEA
jgi:hypothetical protein